jgi:hypothetical protein
MYRRPFRGARPRPLADSLLHTLSDRDWVPDEVSSRVEEAERRRTCAVAIEFAAVLDPKQDELFSKWESAQQRLWNESVKRRLRSRPSTWEAFAEETSEEGKWLTRSRKQHDFLGEVPRAIQDALLGQLAGKLRYHYFQRGDAPQRWQRTSLEFPLLRFTSPSIRLVSPTSIKLPKIGMLSLRGDVALPTSCEITKVHIARDGDHWRVLVYALAPVQEPGVEANKAAEPQPG